MTTFRRVTLMHALVALMVLPSTLGYATSAAPISKPAFLPTTQELLTKTIPPNQSHRYDLCIGKNAPVTTDRQSNAQPNNIKDASQFWTVPEPAVTFPSPPLIENPVTHGSFTLTTEPSVPKVSKKSIRWSIPLDLKRQSEDDLQILSNGDIMPRTNHVASNLDLNTVWVEAIQANVALTDSTK